jgi:alpha-tubulin suppressor-like RCC1 family protein
VLTTAATSLDRPTGRARPERRRARAAVLIPALLLAACAGDGPAGPTPPASALRYQAISAGYYHTCALTPTGTAYCWGGNEFGTLGDGSFLSRQLPAPVAGGRSFDLLDAGAGHNCALTAAGAAWCWGQNDEGQLGDGTFTRRSSPSAVTGGHVFTTISAGHAHSCALTAAGAAWCWGDDSRGQLGDGPGGPARSADPVRVQTGQSFAAIHAGYYQTCAITTDGTAECWGLNGSGQNGDGTTDDRHAPVSVGDAMPFTSLATGDRFVCGRRTDGVWCWGENAFDQLGSSAPDTSSAPLRIDGTSTLHGIIASIGASTVPGTEAYACGIGTDGRAVCWGGAVRGLRPRGDPARLDAGIRASTIAAGPEHICVLRYDGYAFCGGANYAGQLGDGTRTDRTGLVPVHGYGDD